MATVFSLVLVLALAPLTLAAQQDPTPDAPTARGMSSSSTSDGEGELRSQDSAKKKTKRKKLKRAERERLTTALDAKYRQWLEDVEVLISEDELIAFLEIDKDHQRDAFIERFWAIRDPYAENARNEFRQRWYDRLAEAAQLFGPQDEDRRRYYLLNGPPTARLPFQCTTATYPMELWYYRRSERVAYEFTLLFVRKYGRPEYSLWTPADRLDAIFSSMGASSSGVNLQEAFQDLQTCKDGQIVLPSIAQILRRPMEFDMLLARIEEPVENPSPEWLATFASYSTDLPDAAETFAADLEFEFPERIKSRIVVAATLLVDPEQIEPTELGGVRSYNLALVGEVLREGKLFESYRYQFDVPIDGEPARTPGEDPLELVFERRLRPGSYRMILRLEDVNSRRYFRASRKIEVPHLESEVPIDAATREALDAAAAVLDSERVTLQIVPPISEMQTGYTRFDTLVTGVDKIDEVRFALNERVRMQKRLSPYSVELDLGRVPRTHRLRVSAHDASGAELASDELVINQARNAFAVRLVQPTRGEYSGRLRAVAAVDTPKDSFVQKVEFFLGERLLATVFQEPWESVIDLGPTPELTYVRALATLSDGNTAEDLVFINAPDYLESVEVQYVELYASVTDRNGRPIQDLTREQFSVSEDGQPQEIRRFEKVQNLPVHIQVMIDTSASMEEDLPSTQQAALAFFESSIKPKDRASLITFNDHPRMAVEATNEPRTLAGGLAGLKAERGTALYDALIFALYHLNGIKGQRAILLLSDGKDESSRFDFDDTLEYARRAGVAIYAVGLSIKGKDSRQARSKLSRFAEETGGSAFFIESVNELPGVYAQIEQELRSRYLITYQSSNATDDTSFRVVELETSRPGTIVKTIRGYYP